MNTTRFLLGAKLSWDYFLSADGVPYTRLSDCTWSLVAAAILVCLRLAIEKYLFVPLAAALGLYPRKQKKLKLNNTLEKIYQKWGRKSVQQDLKTAAESSDLSPAEARAWLRARYSRDSPSELDKFTESGYFLIYYSTIFTCTLYYIRQEDWLWDTRELWRDWPRHPVLPGVFCVYMVQMGHYLSMLFSILFLKSHRLKDKGLMIVHHIITVSIMALSWNINAARVGVLVLLTHDFADPGLLLARLLWTVKKKKAAEKALFVGFTIWVLSRLVVLPFKVIKSTMFDVLEVNPRVGRDMAIYWATNILLVLLMLLHIHWTVMFLKLIKQKVAHGEIKKDEFDISNSEEEEKADGDDGKKSQ